MPIEYKDYYAILGLTKEAEAEDIKQAYRRLAKRHHPDLHAEKNKTQAESKFKEINEAYEVLSDPNKKAKYDRIGPGWEAGPDLNRRPREEAAFHGFAESGRADFSGFSDFFERLFGDAGGRGFKEGQAPRGATAKGQDVEAELPLSLEEAFHGGDKRLTLTAPVICPSCGGSGGKAAGFCPTCGGIGETRREKTIKTHLPRHVSEGMKLRLRGQGSPGPGGGEPGDLFVRIRLLAHPLYKVSGSDLETTVTLMPWVAALGGEAAVPTLEGTLLIKIPAATHAGRSFRIPGKGLSREGGSRGDLYAVTRIDIPEKIGSDMEKLYREMSEAPQ